MIEPAYIIGIDLGTTNSAVSYAEIGSAEGRNRGIRLFHIPQLTEAGEVERLQVLPSFCYLPGKYDVDPGSLKMPWQTDAPSSVTGAFARDQGARVPARLVSSAKSWLCHERVDRRGRILPWGAEDTVEKISPVEATAAYLSHIRNSWNHEVSDDDLRMENQFVIITVPASFDEVARDLTLEGAVKAGLPEVILLEEPLSAFYSWLIRHEKDWRNHIRPGELVLVCDVGGGTTDFTLISLRETEGTPRFERIAVGDHLILGGDNIDQAVASKVEKQFGPGANLSADRWKTLCHLCRRAKENILNHGNQAETITMMGGGSRLIGGTLTAEITRESLEEIILEQFFPLAQRSDQGASGKQAETVSEFGLPCEPDTAITRHIGRFLDLHAKEAENLLGRNTAFPDLVLFNGGSLKAGLIRERILEALRKWFGRQESGIPRVLENDNPDVAVALGASYYGLVKQGKGVAVGSGSPRTYYLGIKGPDKGDDSKQAVCVLERGTDQDTAVTLEDRKFEVLANRPVNFEVFSSSYRSGDRTGDVVAVDETMTRLPPLQTVIRFGQKSGEKRIPVQVEARYTETGVLLLWCRSVSTGHKWQLRFQLRQIQQHRQVEDTDVFDSRTVKEVTDAVDRAFAGDSGPERLSGLMKTISDIVGRGKNEWPLSLLRAIADALLERAANRKYSSEHEIRWLNLTGFSLRPGFGDGFDGMRIKRLWKIYKTGMVFKNSQQARNEWWILWRRVAGGLSAGQQRQAVQDLRPVLIQRRGGKTKISPQELLEMWMTAANMERISVGEKTILGDALMSGLHPKKSKPQQFWALSRIGARQPLYGPVDRVVAPEKASGWADSIMQQDWKNPSAAGSALAGIARKTGDRTRDLDEHTRQRIAQWLKQKGMEERAQPVMEIVAVKRKDEAEMFGESLPSGLIMHE